MGGRSATPGIVAPSVGSSTLQTAGPDHAPEEPQAEESRECEADHRDHVDPEHVRTALREDPDQARADQAAGDDQRNDEAVEHALHLLEEVVEPLVNEADLDLPVANLLHEVVPLKGSLAQNVRVRER